jgi:hypothetical protein
MRFETQFLIIHFRVAVTSIIIYLCARHLCDYALTHIKFSMHGLKLLSTRLHQITLDKAPILAAEKVKLVFEDLHSFIIVVDQPHVLQENLTINFVFFSRSDEVFDRTEKDLSAERLWKLIYP